MPRIRTRAPLGLLTACLALAGCAADSNTSARTFEPGVAGSTKANVRLELREAVYTPRRLTLSLLVTNLGGEPLTIPREGILLEQRDLELPIEALATSPVAEITEVPAGGSAELKVAFAGAPAEGVLRLRALERGDVELDVVDLPVPGPPAPPD